MSTTRDLYQRVADLEVQVARMMERNPAVYAFCEDRYPSYANTGRSVLQDPVPDPVATLNRLVAEIKARDEEIERLRASLKG